MMKKRILFLVNTPYQLMISINLKQTIYVEYDADIVITNNISNHESLAGNVRDTRLFGKVIVFDIKDIYPDSNSVALVKRLFGDGNIFTEAYDYYLFANLDHGASGIYRMLRKNNKRVKAIMFEDGYATYSGWYSDFLTMFGSVPNDNNPYRRPFYKTLFHRWVDNVFSKVEKLLVFNPSIMTYQPAFDVQTIEPIDTRNEKLVEIYNSVFGYETDVDAYKEPVIFFEESYFADGYNVDDIGIVEQIADIVGKNNIFIKIHPRNPENRFKKNGYKTNQNTSIPWEVICMNMDLKNKILVSISSVAVIVPATMLGKEYTGILLMNAMKDDSCLKKNITNLYEAICAKEKNLCVVSSMEELHTYIKNSSLCLEK